MAWKPWDRDDWYPPSKPRAVRGGIRAGSKRGRFGETWWAARWIAVLESFDIGARLQRGRSYARHGQVLSIDIEKGVVSARVQGSRRAPYKVAVTIGQLKPAEWRRVTDRIAGQAIFAAKLLAGEMPQDIEEAFTTAGVSLFPEKSRELVTACSCPDWSNPCKHVAAVYYLLGEEFDRDPFLLFRLRGLEREELMTLLQEPPPSLARATRELRRGLAVPGHGVSPASAGGRIPPTSRRKKKTVEQPTDARHVDAPPSAGRPLVAEPARFWQAPSLPEDFHGAVEIPQAHAALVRRLGRFPFWRGETPIGDALGAIYAAASPRGLKTFIAGTPAVSPET
jgi:uncharacterized Zn finger protein